MKTFYFLYFINNKMQHQDWNTVTFNNVSETKKREEYKKINSNKTSNPNDFTLEAPTNLGKIISQARTAKNINQKQLSASIGVSQQILSRWESGKETPNNSQIATIEKHLGVKLPRCKKVAVKDIA